MKALFDFPADMGRLAMTPNALNTQVLVQHYQEEWSKISR